VPDRARLRRGRGGPALDLAAIADGTPLEVDADLRLRVTATNGASTTARVTGRGRELRVEVEQPDVLLAAVDPRDVGRVADLLAASGITAHVVGPDGPAATVGAGASSRLGLLSTGSARVAPVPKAAAELVLGMRGTRVGAVVVSVAVAALVLLRRLARRS
jgi:translation initiation factor IF-1